MTSPHYAIGDMFAKSGGSVLPKMAMDEIGRGLLRRESSLNDGMAENYRAGKNIAHYMAQILPLQISEPFKKCSRVGKSKGGARNYRKPSFHSAVFVVLARPVSSREK